MPPPVVFSEVIRNAQTQCKLQATEALSRKRVHVYGERTDCAKRHRTEGATGELQLEHLLRLLDSFGMKRSHVQKQLHLGMAGSVLQRIFCNDSDAEMKLAMVQHKITSCRQQFMAITPRRFGCATGPLQILIGCVSAARLPQCPCS